jgi:signal transduction histidine kinase
MITLPRPGGGTDPVGVVAGTAAQEIGSALTAIQVATERLERDRGVEVTASLELRVIREQSERLARLARHLLELAHPPPGEGGRWSEVELVGFMARIVSSLRPELVAEGVELRVGGRLAPTPETGTAQPLPVRAAPLHLREVVLSLLGNARTAARGAPGPGWVQVEVHPRAEGGGEIRVSDSGPGVPVGAEERIFLPFVSGWGREGMGLSRSRSFLARVGGDLSLVRTDDGNTQFVLTLEPPHEDLP